MAKSPAESLTISNTVIDYGNSPLLGAKISITLLRENVDVIFGLLAPSVLWMGKHRSCRLLWSLGGASLADYMYTLKSKVNKINKLKVTK